MIHSDAFLGQPYAYLTNQCGHMILGLAVAVFTPLHWGFDPVIAALIYWLLIEVLDQRLRLFWDAAEDTMWVMIGAMILTIHDWGQMQYLMAMAGAGLAFGYWRRT